MYDMPIEEMIKAVREEEFEGFKPVKEWKADTAALYIKDKTALFSFDQFINNIVKDLKWSLEYAEKNGCKNFVIDLSANKGGAVSAAVVLIGVAALAVIKKKQD